MERVDAKSTISGAGSVLGYGKGVDAGIDAAVIPRIRKIGRDDFHGGRAPVRRLRYGDRDGR